MASVRQHADQRGWHNPAIVFACLGGQCFNCPLHSFEFYAKHFFFQYDSRRAGRQHEYNVCRFDAEQCGLGLDPNAFSGGEQFIDLVNVVTARTKLGLTAAAIATPSSLTETGSNILTITGGSAALLAGVTIQVSQVSTTTDGYVSAANWNGFLTALSSSLQIANNLSDLANKATAFNNISPLTTLGDTLYAGASGVDMRLAGSISTTKLFKTQTGTGSVSAAPAWAAIVAADVPVLNQNTTGTAANVTGVVAIVNGGTGASTAATALTALGGASLTAANAFTGANTFATGIAVAGTTARQQLSVGSGLDLYTNAASQSPTVPSIRGGTAALVINCMSGGGIFFNYDTGAGCPINFCNGSGGIVASISSGGAGSFSALSSSGSVTGTLGGWTSWTPTLTAGGSMTATAPTAVTASYLRIGPFVHFRLTFTTTLGGAVNLLLTVNGIPIGESLGIAVPCNAQTTVSGVTKQMLAAITSSSITITPAAGTGSHTAGANVFSVSGHYQCA